MTTPDWRVAASAIDYDELDRGGNYAVFDELLPGERIGSPLASVRRKIVRRVFFFFMLVACGGGWAMFGDTAALKELVSPLTEYVRLRLVEASAPAADTSVAAAKAEPPAAVAPLPERLVESRSIDSGVPIPTATEPQSKSAAVPEAGVTGEAAGNAAPPPLPKPVADPSDPYQKRALAVGLHPELSRVLLARLSTTDYKNAGVAIQTALAKTPDDAVFTWPRQPKGEQALFEVHFVAGSSPKCRRYVVTVTKDGWLTTAPPLENCSSEQRPQSRG